MLKEQENLIGCFWTIAFRPKEATCSNFRDFVDVTNYYEEVEELSRRHISNCYLA
jgi:hypothetical protein